MESEIKVVFQYRAPGGRVVEGEFAVWRVADEAGVPEVGQIVSLESEAGDTREDTREYSVVSRNPPNPYFLHTTPSGVPPEITLTVTDVPDL